MFVQKFFILYKINLFYVNIKQENKQALRVFQTET